MNTRINQFTCERDNYTATACIYKLIFQNNIALVSEIP